MASDKSPDDMLRINDIAREYRLGRERIRKLVKAGEIRHIRVGTNILIPRWCLLEWIKENVSGHPMPLTR